MTGLRIGILGAARIAPARADQAGPRARGCHRGRRRRARPVPGRGLRGPPRHRRRATATTPTWWPTPSSTRSTTRCPTVCTASGRWPRSKPASTCCARSPSPPTRTRRWRWRRWPSAPGLVVAEAFHYRYHPLARRMREVVEQRRAGSASATSRPAPASRCPGSMTSATASTWPAARSWTPAATRCTMLRLVGDGRARGDLGPGPAAVPGVDRAMQADLRFPSGATGRLVCSMWSRSLLHLSVRVVG